MELDWSHITQRDNQCCRRRGRPAVTWRRQLTKEINQSGKSLGKITHLARERRNWKLFLDDLYFK